MKRLLLAASLLALATAAPAQTYNLNDLSPAELNQLSRGLFFVGGWDLHSKLQGQINAQEQARYNALLERQRADEAALRKRLTDELKAAAPVEGTEP